MKICIFTPTFLPLIGGAELMADALARGFQSRGHEVVVLAPSESGKTTGLPYPVIRYRFPPKRNLWPEVLGLPLKRAHRKWGFDVVLSFYSYPVGYAASRLKEKLGFALITNPHGNDIDPKYHAHKKWRVTNVARAGYRDSDRIISISDYVTERLHTLVGEGLPPIDVVYNGIDLAAHDKALGAGAASTAPAGIDADERFILHLGRVGHEKRLDLAIEAVARLRDRFEKLGLSYVIAGDGGAMDDMRQLVKDRGLEKIVKFVGRCGGDAKYWLLSHARFMVSTSWEEGGRPLVMIEAMASGLGVLASDLPTHREMGMTPGSGYLFENGNVEDLIEKMDTMLEAETEPWRANGLKARESYGIDRVVDGYLESCRLAMEGRGL